MAALQSAPEILGLATGVAVADVATGDVWAAVDADRLLNPASNEKLPTTAAALVLLGPEHRFEATVKLAAGGVVVLSGGGDPSLDTAALDALAAAAADALRGTAASAVEADESPFAGSALPPGFEAKATDAAYRAATGHTAINEGTYRVTLSPTRVGSPVKVELDPPGSYLVLDNRANTVAGKSRRIGVESKGATGLVVRGRLGVDATQNPVAVRRVDDPSLVAATAFRALLKRHGVTVSGPARVRRVPVEAGAKILATRRSAPLSELVAHVNKTSSNFGAEMLLRAIALTEAQAGRGPANWETATAAVLRVATATLGLETGSLEVRNGSGLYDGGRITARALARLLTAMHGQPAFAAFDASLAVAGVDGTLAGRLLGATTAKHVRAKTGTLDAVSSLAGYVPTRSGRLLAFVVLMNGKMKSAAGARKVQDRLVTALAALP